MAMRLLAWLGQKPRSTPLLLRLRVASGDCPDRVELDVRFHPCQTRVQQSVITSSGMLLLPWHNDAERADIRIRAGSLAGELSFSGEHAQSGAAHDVQLVHRVPTANM